MADDDFSGFADAPPPVDSSSGDDFSQFKDAEIPLSDVPGMAAKNLLPSAGKFVGSLAEPFVHPTQALNAIGQVGKGLYSKGEGLFYDQDPAKKAQDEAVVNAIGQDYSNAYGGWNNIKQTMATDPVRFLTDAATIATGGEMAAAKVPGLVGTGARAASGLVRAADPASIALKTAQGVASGAGEAGASGLGGLSGVSSSTIKQAAKAGYAGDSSIWDIPTGKVPSTDGIQVVQDALSKVAAARRAEYEAGMNGLSLTSPLDYTDVNKAFTDWQNKSVIGNQPKSLAVNKAIQDTGKLLSDWQSAPAGSPEHTMAGFDALKQRLDELSGTYKGTPAQNGIQQIRNAVKQTIVSKDPGYAEVMDRYFQATNNLRDLYSDVLAGNNKTPGVQIRKIISDLDSSHKGDLINQLSNFNPAVPNTVAGLELANAGGHGGAGIGGALVGAALGHPEGLMLAPFTVPKVAAAVPYYAARVANMPKNAINSALSKAGQYVPPAVQQMAQKAGNVASNVSSNPLSQQAAKQAIMNVGRQGQQQNQQGVVPGLTLPPYKRGGKTGDGGMSGKMNHAKQASKLILAAERAKKNQGKMTKPLLDVSDNVVAHALDVANRKI